MSTLKEAEKARGMAQEKHRQAKKRLETALTPVRGVEPNSRVIQPLLDKLEQTFEAVLDAHVTYVLKKGAGLEEDVHTHWMDQRQTEHDDVMDAAQVVLGLADETGAPIVEAENPEE